MKVPARSQKRLPWVLVVDDEAMSARATARLVTAQGGATVSVVGCVDDAVRLILGAARPPRLLLLDFELARGETGLGALLTLRAAGCDAPAAFYTGAPEKARRALHGAGVEGCPVFCKGADGAAVAGLLGDQLGSNRSGVRRRLA